MTYESAKTLGKEVCDVMQLLEAVAKAYNHREQDAKLQQIISPAMKVCAALLRKTLTELNMEELSHLCSWPAVSARTKSEESVIATNRSA